MGDIDQRTQINLDVVLEETCRVLPHGGDHETRKFIAESLIDAAQSGNITMDDLREVARRSLLIFQKSA